MPQAKVNAESAIFTPSALIELWKLDGTAIGLQTVYYFCDGTSTSFQPVVFNSVSYTPFPIKVDSMIRDAQGTLPRPRLTVSNINGFMSAILLDTGQLVGATITRTRVFARFLDAVNFQGNGSLPSWVTPDPTASYSPESFVVNRKVVENQQIVQFELASPLEMQNVQLPRRQIIANLCQWKYRDPNTCGYSGPPISDIANKSFGAGGYNLTLVSQGDYSPVTTYNAGDYVVIYSTLPQFITLPVFYVCLTNGTLGIDPKSNPSNWVADACPRTIAGCKLRFTNVPLRTSAFPGVSRAGWIAQA